jgi:hypothetical protein
MNTYVISEKIGTTRQNVSNILKKAIGKCYKYVYRNNPYGFTPLQCFLYLLCWIDIFSSLNMYDLSEMKKFFRLFPGEIRDKIQIDVEKYRNEISYELLKIRAILDEVYETERFEPAYKNRRTY